MSTCVNLQKNHRFYSVKETAYAKVFQLKNNTKSINVTINMIMTPSNSYWQYDYENRDIRVTHLDANLGST